MKKVAIFGGSFNPPHIGHRCLIELVRDTFPCNEIWLIPSGDRKDKLMDVEGYHRLAMAELFAKELIKTTGPEIKISKIEMERKVPTATIDTLKELQALHPDYEFHFVVSSELVPVIKKLWVQGEEVFATTKFIIIERPGFNKISEIELPPLCTLLTAQTPLPEISSTSLRMVTNKKQLIEGVGPTIAQYIIENKLYGLI